jgi:glycogen debranching enzyme
VVFKPRNFLVRLRPRQETLYISQNRSVLATGRDGFIRHGSPHGLFVCQTRLLSHYRYLINGAPPLPVALSNVEQHTWLGYYIVLPPGVREERDLGSGQMEAISQHTLELRLSRFVGNGLHEDADITNFTQQEASVTLTIEFDADFADVDETKGDRWQVGGVRREWRRANNAWELLFDYASEHAFNNQEGTGTKRVQRGLILRIENPSSAPTCQGNKISFNIRLGPHESWHTCVNFIPLIDGTTFKPPAGCPSFAGTQSEYDRRRRLFLSEATQFTSPQAETLSTVVLGTLEQAKRDLASLRLYDLDHGDRAWTMAAGLPVYVSLFGRDSLTAAWQAALVTRT